jgi:hypothetical protein
VWFFGDITLSVAGVVVLAFVVLGLRGDVVFGRRIWRKVTLVALLAIGGIAHFKPDDFEQAITTMVATKTKEAQEQMAPIIAALTSWFAPPPAP